MKGRKQSGYARLSHPLQEIARGEGQGVSDSISLDVHAIAELKEKGVPPTNDMFKYNYVADDRGSYSEFDRVVWCLKVLKSTEPETHVWHTFSSRAPKNSYT